MTNPLPRIGLISFADSRTDQALVSEAHQYIYSSHLALARDLTQRGCVVIDPLNDPAFQQHFAPVTSLAERDSVIRYFQAAGAEAIVIGCWRWSEPMPIVDLVRRLDLPAALFGHQDANWSGFGGITAIGAALWEVNPNRAARVHARIRDDVEELAAWARGVVAYHRLRRSRLLLWGGTSCMGMEHIPDDLSQLKAWLVGDILSEGQYYLIKRAEALLQDGHSVRDFAGWLEAGGARIVYDQSMLTASSLARQAALYLAAEQRLDELGRDSIAGVSVLCQKELSAEYGVTPCFIPALMPFAENQFGQKRSIPAVCEGDVKSLITSVLFDTISPEAPAQFGDLREINGHPNWVVIANCGGSSLFYAANSNRAADALPNVTLQGQIHGVSGAAITFKGKAMPATVARLVRVHGSYWMHLGYGHTVDVSDEVMNSRKWAKEWPTVIVDMGVDTNAFTRVAASNHYLLVPGDRTREMRYACAQAGIPVLRIDTPEGINQAVEAMTAGDGVPW